MKIDPANVHLDAGGFVTRSWFVRLPRDMTADDLKEPSLWRAVQRENNKRLKKHDTAYLVAFDESFAVSAVVVDATPEAVVLGGMKVTKFRERLTPLFTDSVYKVEWCGTGYQVIRIADGAKMGEPLGSEALAINHIKTLYPKPVGAA